MRSIKSAERTLRLFELFSRRQASLTVGEVSRGLGIPQPSASMLLSNLADLGYLAYRRVDRSYAPTIRVVLLASSISPRLRGARSLAQMLDDLQRSVDEDIYVGIQNGSAAQIVQVQGGDLPLSIDSDQKYSLTCTAIGQALLSIKPTADVLLMARRCNAEAEPQLRVNESEFVKVVLDVRRLGYARTSGHLSPTRTSIALPVPASGEGVDFAVGCSGPTVRIEAKLDQILEALRAFQTGAAPS